MHLSADASPVGQNTIEIHSGAIHRQSSPSVIGPRFVVYTVPKCGSHLLASCLNLLTQKKNKFLPTWPIRSKKGCTAHLRLLGSGRYEMSHEPYRPHVWEWWRALNVRGLFIVRDPRDATVSMANWIAKGGVYPEDSETYKYFMTLSPDEQIRWVIQHVNGRGMAQLFQARLGWMTRDSVLTIRFEDLVGPQGGGTEHTQLQTIYQIAEFLEVPVDPHEIRQIVTQMYGHKDSPTFNKGQIGVWVDAFDEETKNLAKQEFGELLISLGYENSLNW